MNPSSRPLLRSDWPIAALLLLSAGLWVICDRELAGPDTVPFLYGTVGMAWYVLGAMLVAWVASRTSAPRVPYRQSLFLLAACAPPAILLLWAGSLAGSDDLDLGLSVLAALTGVGVLAWGLRRVSGRGQLLAVWLSLMTAVGFGWVSDALYVQPGIWYPVETDEATDAAAWNSGERLLFEQPERVDRAVRQVADRDPGRPNAYFIGFAGYGGQKVFAEEIQLASRVIGVKYGSTNHSVRLINDPRNASTFPLATTSGLRRALLELGQRMDRSSDVLFLVLSSHGSEGAEIAVQNRGLPLAQLSGDELADALRAAGIRWKVVVISACFSGAFIDALKDDHSIIVAASAPDRTSFGCSDDRDLTYFGEAFFRDALPAATSLRQAFELAKASIARREREEDVTPSRPQAYFGAEMEKRAALLMRN